MASTSPGKLVKVPPVMQGDKRAHDEGDESCSRDALAEVEVLLLALANYPVGGYDDAGQRRDESAHEGQEALEGVQQAEGGQQGTNGAGDAGSDLELALVKAEQVAQREAAGVGVRDIGRPGGEHQGNEAQDRHAEGDEDGRDVVLAGDDAHESAGQQHEQTSGHDADYRGFHDVSAALGEAAVVRRNNAAKREGATTIEMPKTSPEEVSGA